MKFRTLPSVRETLNNSLPQPFQVEAPYRQQIQQMEEQNKTSGLLIMLLFVIAGVTILAVTASEARAWQRVSQKKS